MFCNIDAPYDDISPRFSYERLYLVLKSLLETETMMQVIDY